jgi:hypothetical protein
VFFLNLPFAIGALLAAPRFAPVTRPRPRAVEPGGQLLAIAGLVIAGCAFLAGAALVGGPTREPG